MFIGPRGSPKSILQKQELPADRIQRTAKSNTFEDHDTLETLAKRGGTGCLGQIAARGTFGRPQSKMLHEGKCNTEEGREGQYSMTTKALNRKVRQYQARGLKVIVR